jgi:hypothetical protein
MSSDASPPPYSGDAQPPQYQMQPPPQAYQPQPQGAYQPSAYQPQPYVEQAPPPGAYVPAPPPPGGPGRGRGAKVAVAAILSVVLLAAVGAVVLFKFILVNGPDPAESFPATASMYMEINLDPSLDQTPKLLDHLSKFDDLEYDSTDDLVADLLEESGLEGVDAEEDLTSWLGSRHGMAMWEYEGQPYAVVSLASTDANAAEDGLADLRAAAQVEENQMAYAVEDDHVLIVAGETGAAEALSAAESEAGSEPLAASPAYEDARAWLDGDQLVTYWIDMDALAGMEALAGAEYAALEELYSGQLIAGLSAFDEGFELNYRLFGAEDDPWTGSDDLMASMGDLPASDFAASAYIPENVGELADEWMNTYEDLEPSEEATDVEVLEPLTDAEYTEYMELQTGYYEGTLSAEEESRYLELENRYWTAGTEDEPYDTGDYDYGPDMEEVRDQVNRAADLLAGSSLSFGGNFHADEGVDPESLHFSALLAEERAQELEDFMNELPEGAEVDGSSFSYTGSGVASETLAEDGRFSDFAAAAPSSTAVAVWVDLAAAAETYPDDFDGAEPLSAIAWAHGSDDGDGTGVVRLYLKD